MLYWFFYPISFQIRPLFSSHSYCVFLSPGLGFFHRLFEMVASLGTIGSRRAHHPPTLHPVSNIPVTIEGFQGGPMMLRGSSLSVNCTPAEIPDLSYLPPANKYGNFFHVAVRKKKSRPSLGVMNAPSPYTEKTIIPFPLT